MSKTKKINMKKINMKKINMKNKTKQIKFKIKGGHKSTQKGGGFFSSTKKNQQVKPNHLSDNEQKTIYDLINADKLNDKDKESLRILAYKLAQNISNQTAEAILKKALGIKMRLDDNGNLVLKKEKMKL